ncbi:unnamed protein product, partial [Prorocentrum cordatum]
RRRPRPRRRQAACSCPGPQDPEGRRGRHGGGARASLAAAGHAGQAPGPDVRHLDAREGRGRGSRGRRAHARLVLQVCGEGAGGGPGRGGGRGRAGGRRRRRGGGRGAGRDGLRGASPRPPSLTSCSCGLHVSGARLGSARAPRRAPSLRSRAVLARSPCTETSTRAPAGSLGPPEAAEAAGARGPREEPGPAPASCRVGAFSARGCPARGVISTRSRSHGIAPGAADREGVGTDMAAARGAPGALAPRRPRPLELAGCPAVCAARWAVDTFSVHCLWPCL